VVVLVVLDMLQDHLQIKLVVMVDLVDLLAIRQR
tara:strand:- start:464 stop:565 length:102 start_codon:yes stop_codon:yes gene_type:complete